MVTREQEETVLSHAGEFDALNALSASSMRLVLAAALNKPDVQIEELIRLLEQTTTEIRFNQELLSATLEHLSQGISVVDKDLRLVAWNHRYVELFEYPERLITRGCPIEDVVRYNAGRGLLSEGGGDHEDKIARRIGHMREGHAYMHERELPNGMVIEIRGNPLPGGGFVTSYSDVTAYKRAQRALEDINETLETRVEERTAELTTANAALSEAKLAAERANQSKTRFLASASHDLVQPLNAARLFVASMDRRKLRDTEARLITQIENSLSSAESLLSALLDISRLDAAAQELKSEHFELSRVLGPLAAEFAALARQQSLEFRVVPSRAVVHTDPRLLRRVLQNFLSNAVRYTHQGKVLIGCRRLAGALRIEVWDTGVGVPPEKQKEIFEEFRRLDTQQIGTERGLGLGLAIAERLARLMDHPLGLRSWPGHGSVFSITVPLGDAAQVSRPAPTAVRNSADRVSGACVLCLDNEPAVLEGMRTLLSGWGVEVIAVRDPEAALLYYRYNRVVPDLALIDYHLDHGVDGIGVLQSLEQTWGKTVPGIVITADHTQQARSAAEAHGYALLPKPLKPAALRALMSRMLTQSALNVGS